MSQYLRFCPNCNSKDIENKHKIRGRYATYLDEFNYTCEVCGNRVVDLNILSDDYKIIVDISDEPSFIKAMIELHDTNVIEYNLKMTQFRNQVNQYKQRQENIKPHCPTCNSTDIKLIPITLKVANTAMFGLLGSKRHKTYHCNNCKYEW